jgi:hypothetical protein
MPMKFLGKMMFPSLPAWQAKRQARHLMVALSVAVFFGLVIVAVMLLQNAPH